ncbi:AAA domain-containing protein [Kineococcus glutinatus]|uniref:Very short patch repair endonuclease n=1 Tax=Kineococcus glutinatus TaxID=1070872 RepID=A0ABP9H4U7_9ACTN
MAVAESALSRQMVGQTARLVEFLRDLARAGRAPVLDVAAYRHVLWLVDLPEGVAADSTAEVGDVLCSFAPVPAEAAPALPGVLHGWVETATIDDSSAPLPELQEAPLTLEALDSADAAPSDREVRRAYERWSAEWTAWAECDRRTAPARRWYDELSTIYRQLSQQDDQYELVLATGLITVQPPKTPRVRNHLLSTRLGIEVDERTGVLRLAVAEGGGLRVHDRDLLTGVEGFDAARAEPSRVTARAMEAGPLADDNHELLEQWRVLGLPSCRAYEKDWQPQEEVAATPVLRFAPALVLRPRGRASLIGYYERMLEALSGADGAAPLGLAQLLTALEPHERRRWLAAEGSTTELTADPLFPLPANPEQARIMTRLRHETGVVVQGPPGTGKTHTIANLVSALVAEGQRVLVTSQKAQALAVLRDKLPAEVQQLCVSMTDQGRGGSAELSRSVNALVDRHSSFDQAEYTRAVADLAAQRDAARSAVARLTEQIRALRESETYHHPEVAPGYSGTLGTIAARLRDRRERLGWMPTPLPTGAPASLPVPAARIGELVGLLAGATAERRARTAQVIPPGDALLSPEVLTGLVAAERAAAVEARAARSDLTEALQPIDDAAFTRLQPAAERIGAGLSTLRSGPADWRQQCLDDALAGRDASLWQQVSDVADRAEDAERLLRSLGLRTVELPAFEATGAGSRAGQLAAGRALHEYFRSGGKLKGLLKPAVQKQAAPLLDGAAVDGLAPTNAELLELVLARLEAEVTVDALAARWADVGLSVPADAPLGRRISQLVGAARELTSIGELVQAMERMRDELAAAGVALSLTTWEQWAELVEGLESVRAQLAARRATDAVDRAVEDVERIAGVERAAPECRNLITAARSRDVDAYAAACTALADARIDVEQQARADELWRELNAAHPGLAQLVQATAGDPAWQQRLGSLADAWAWAAAQTFFDAQRAPGREAQLDQQLDEAIRTVRSLTAQLAAAKAWQACLARMTAKQSQALRSYQQNTKSMGKGTGKYVHYYARGAREAMADARGAVPAWIMPLAEVLETVPPDKNSFDVVIIDEASQASIEALFLLWLAPRVIVVGDDKQCAPSAVSHGELQPIFDKLDDYLPDLPRHLRNSLTPRDSLFSLLKTRFGGMVQLREHFRCMPEIIDWSSRQFYAESPLVPLRQFGSDRLQPLRLTHVPGAVSDGVNARLRNKAEATAIAERVATCLDDPAYRGKTFGVIVLQGQAQVDLIEDELRRLVPADAFEQRKLRVGTPPDFQGDERHVAFLSMVVAEKRNALSREEDQRRFNVAASRAQDQMWLFHSVTPDLLSPKDLRRSLLTYLINPPAPRVASDLANVTPDEPHEPFDSLFEQRVYLRIRERGYQVTPQWEVNGRRIDLVVTGAKGRLAVECDGEHWHSSPEQRLNDLHREQELKRAGWQFWRVRDSEFNYDPDRAMAGLWEALERRGIHPHEGVERTPLSASAEDWVPTELVKDDTAVVGQGRASTS